MLAMLCCLLNVVQCSIRLFNYGESIKYGEDSDSGVSNLEHPLDGCTQQVQQTHIRRKGGRPQWHVVAVFVHAILDTQSDIEKAQSNTRPSHGNGSIAQGIGRRHTPQWSQK